MTDLIDWDSLRSPTTESTEACPNCQSTNSRLQARQYEINDTVRQNIHCADCGWGWSHIAQGHDSYHRRWVRGRLEQFGCLYLGEMSDAEREQFEALGEALESLAEHYGIEYPLRTFD